MVGGKTIQNLLNKTTSKNTSIIKTSLAIRIIPVILTIPILLHHNMLKILNTKFLFLSLISGLLVGISTILLIKSYKIGEVSIITPFYSLTPIFGGIFSWFFLSQSISYIGIFGIFLICIGAYIIKLNNFSTLTEPIRKLYTDKSILYIIFYALIIGIVAPVDSLGVNNVNPVLWLFYIYIFSTITILFYYMYKNGIHSNTESHELKTYLKLFLIGFFTFVSIISTLYLYQTIKVAYVLSIFMTNILFTSIIASIVYNEKLTVNKIFSTIIMTIGAIMIIMF